MYKDVDTEKGKASPAKKDVTGKTFRFEEVMTASMEYFNGDELAASTWMNKYAMKNKNGEFCEQTPEDMHRRMAREFAKIERNYPKPEGDNLALLSEYGQSRSMLTEKHIFDHFNHFQSVIPQGSVMASLGNPYVIASLSNCVVLPEIKDSYGGIFYTDQQLAQLYKRRCGVGIDISTLRPSGASVSNAAGTSTGAISFMKRFSSTTREVAQNGRRGALMITIDIAHPEVEEFVKIKQDLSQVTGANISVRLSDEFMEAVAKDTTYTHRFPINSSNPTVTKKVNAKELWNTIITCAHNTAEPGLIFWDRQHKYSTSSVYPGFENTSTNPCSEIAMQGGDSCRLIAINLYNFIDKPFTAEASFNHEKFYRTTYESQRLMDDLVDLELEAIQKILDKINSDPEPDYIKTVEKETWELLYNSGKNGRRTGLGFTALGDAIAALGMKFDEQEAMDVIDKIMRTKCRAEFDSSIDMSIERGSFKDFNPQIENTSEFTQMLEQEFPDLYHRMMNHGRRNISLSTVAPTGSLSLLAQTSSGIEPVFMTSYTRRRKVNPGETNVQVDFVDDMGDSWQEFKVYHPKIKTWMEITGNTDETKSPYAGSTAPEIDWLKRVETQAIIQKYVTHSISSTINLPNDVSVQMVGDIYMEAWKQGLKGITVYRDGSRSGVLISDSDKGKQESSQSVVETTAPTRPDKIEAEVIHFMNANEKWMAVIGMLNNRPYEVFTGKVEDAFILPAYVEKGWVIKSYNESGNSRYDFQYLDKDGYKVTIEGLSRSFNQEYWNYAKLISGVLRHGMPIHDVVHLVENLNLIDENINTWKNGVIRALKRFVPDGTVAVDHKCPECSDPEGLIYEEGCLKCKSCGHTKCG